MRGSASNGGDLHIHQNGPQKAHPSSECGDFDDRHFGSAGGKLTQSMKGVAIGGGSQRKYSIQEDFEIPQRGPAGGGAPSGFLSKIHMAMGGGDDLPKAVEAKQRGMSDVDSCNLLALTDNTSNMIDLQLQKMKSSHAKASQGD